MATSSRIISDYEQFEVGMHESVQIPNRQETYKGFNWTSRSSSDGEQIEVEMPEFLRIPPSDIKIGDQIGRGGFSTVHKASWRGKQCAAKVVRTANVLIMQKEVVILSKLSHPNIVGCLGFSVDTSRDPSRCILLMELMESDLRHLMNKRLKKKAKDASPFTEKQALNILSQIVAGMEYLHGQRIFHGDLKASNVLVSHGRDGEIHVKITDFGVSQMVKLDRAETSSKFCRIRHFQGAVGTRGYQAPEVSSSKVMVKSECGSFLVGSVGYRGPEHYGVDDEYPKVVDYYSNAGFMRRPTEFYSAKADIYCFAVTCSEILSGRIPFESVSKPDIPALVLRGARPELPHGLDRRLVALINECWDEKPTKRPRFSDIRHSLEMLSRDQSSPERSSENQNSQERGSQDPSCKKAPKCWGRLWRWSRRGNNCQGDRAEHKRGN